MSKPIVKLVPSKSSYSLDKIKKSLSEQSACYVLITCEEPECDGKMNVEMSFEGDEALAALLIENARQVFDNRPEMQKSH